MKKVLVIAAIIIAAVTGYYYYRHPISQKLHIKNHVFTVELAVTEAEKERGLGGRESLAQDAGMLFLYQQKGTYGYWMKGMKIPLDFIWIAGNTIMDISENVPPPKNSYETPAIRVPRTAIDKVLEVNAGTVSRLKINIGDIVQFTD